MAEGDRLGDEMPQVSVMINGRTYRMACDEGEQDRLIGLARRFDGCIAQLRDGFGEIGDQRLAVMAGIMVTDQLAEAERRIAGLAAEIETLREARAAIVDRAAEAEAELARRLDAAAARLEQLADGLVHPPADDAAG